MQLRQYTTTGRVPGIGGEVGRNVFYGSETDWAKFLQSDRDSRHQHRLAAHCQAQAPFLPWGERLSRCRSRVSPLGKEWSFLGKRHSINQPQVAGRQRAHCSHSVSPRSPKPVLLRSLSSVTPQFTAIRPPARSASARQTSRLGPADPPRSAWAGVSSRRGRSRSCCCCGRRADDHIR
jgi:hypothetical protein